MLKIPNENETRAALSSIGLKIIVKKIIFKLLLIFISLLALSNLKLT
jgi:hypothetical protein